MLKQRQSRFGDKQGNCFSTCIASLMDMETDSVPNFCVDGEDAENMWAQRVDEWLKALGYRFIDIEGLQKIVIQPGTTFIASGKSPRGDFLHSIICSVTDNCEFEIIMDPHPSDSGLDGPFTRASFIVKA